MGGSSSAWAVSPVRINSERVSRFKRRWLCGCPACLARLLVLRSILPMSLCSPCCLSLRWMMSAFLAQ